MTSRPRDLATDDRHLHNADQPRSEAELRAADVRSGGDPSGGPRTLRGSELQADDQALAANEDWDDPERL
jgi:hypothetical protein